jgi:hypothetical protein
MQEKFEGLVVLQYLENSSTALRSYAFVKLCFGRRRTLIFIGFKRWNNNNS